ncbi:hypothetical protein TL16_g00321, partial [Triparma laevis f. inornata]
LTQPWSKAHKRMTKTSSGGLPYSLSNSFTAPLTSAELLQHTESRQDADLLSLYSNHPLTYTPNGGSLDLRQDISNLYGPQISPDNVLVFPGAQVALQTSSFAFASEHTIVFTPGYQSTVECPKHAGGSVTSIPLDPKTFQIDLEKVKEAITSKTKYMVINQPYNPAGTLMPLSEYTELISLCRENDIILSSDEVYRLLEHEGTERLPSVADFYEKGISCVTMSKPWGGCGITIGWLVCQDEGMIERLKDVQYFGTACPARASEIQGMMVLRSSEVILEERRKILNDNKKLLISFIDKYSDFFAWTPPSAGATCFINCLPITSSQLGLELAEVGIGVKPAYCFAEKVDASFSGFFRVGFGEREFPERLAKLEEFVESKKEIWAEIMKSKK